MTLDELLRSFGRQTIRIGSSDACEIHLSSSQVPALAAEVVHHGGGRLSILPGRSSSCKAGGRLLQADEAVPFDFDVRYEINGVLLPNAHPALCLMMMGRGHLSPGNHELIVGRNPERCHLVMNSPGVSGLHAIFKCGSELSVNDQNSKSGTWHNGSRLTPLTWHVIPETAILALGPLPLPASLVRDIEQALSHAAVPSANVRTEAMPMPTLERRALPARLNTPPATKHRTVMGTVRMSHATSFTVGRTPDNDIVLDYPQISARHARLVKIDQQVFVEDSGSELGTQVRGSRLKPGQRAQLNDGQRIHFGPIATIVQLGDEDSVQLIVEDRKGWAGRPLFDVAAAGISVEVPDRDDSSKKKQLLRDVHFKAQPGDLVALMGPSGSGKTTLLHTLTGYIRPSAGEILVNGTPLPQVFESLRGSIGYVPQDDIIHPELTVYEAVRYSARFRLPHDYAEDEINRRVHLTLSQLGLEAVAHLQIGRPEHKILSGGQRKRVNIAMELVTDPVLLFLDEPTSGLAADDTTALVELLSTLAHDHGKTIIATIHQPARDEYERFNLALILGHGGLPLYFGPTVEAYRFFEAWRGPLQIQGIQTPRDMFAELREREVRLEKQLPQQTAQKRREAVSEAYSQEYLQSHIFQEMKASGRSTDRVNADRTVVPARSQTRGQLRLLVSRYLKIKQRDHVGTTILLLQAPLIAVLLSLVFGTQKPAVPYWCLGALNELAQTNGRITDASKDVLSHMAKTTDNSGALFFLVVAAVWFGTSNAAREIVSERAIFRRERMVNLGLGRYVLSKFLVLSGLSMVQCAILLGIVFVSLNLAGGLMAFSMSLTMMVLTALCSVALGLLLSAAVASSEAAMALTPIALIPQVVLGGLMVPVTTNALLKWPMLLIPSRWGFEGVVKSERLAISQLEPWQISLPGVPDSISDYIEHGRFLCALAQMESTRLSGAWGFASKNYLPPAVLALMTAALLSMTIIALTRKR